MQSRAASTIAWWCSPASRARDSARRRSTTWPIWLPRLAIAASSSPSGSRVLELKNSITPRVPPALITGEQIAERMPVAAARSARGNSAWAEKSTIQLASAVVHTWPGRPSDRSSAVCRHVAANCAAPSPADGEHQTSAQVSGPSPEAGASQIRPSSHPSESPIASSTCG